MSPSKGQPSPVRVSMVGVEGLRFCVHAWDPPRRRRTTPTLVLPGVAGRGEDFAALAGMLRTDRTVFAADLPGCGDSERRGPYDPVQVAERVAALVLHLADVRVRAAWHRGHLATRLALGEVRVERVLQVWGTDDHWLTPRTAGIVFRDLAVGTPDARQVTVAGGGHRPHLTDPYVVASVVAEFLRSA